MDNTEVAQWLRENPRLDKKMIGEFVSDRKNIDLLESFVSTFSFQGLRLDEALRLYLEAFRLPGEAPVIQRLLEAFTEHWRVSLSDGLSPPSQVHLTEGFYGSN